MLGFCRPYLLKPKALLQPLYSTPLPLKSIPRWIGNSKSIVVPQIGVAIRRGFYFLMTRWLRSEISCSCRCCVLSRKRRGTIFLSCNHTPFALSSPTFRPINYMNGFVIIYMWRNLWDLLAMNYQNKSPILNAVHLTEILFTNAFATTPHHRKA